MSVGPVTLARLPRAARAIEEGRRRGLHLGGQIYVSLRGEVVADDAFGEAAPDPGGGGRPLAWIGMPAEQYAELKERIAACWDTSGPASVLLDWDSEEHCTRLSPAGGGRGPVRELGRFYEMLLESGRLGEAVILRPQTVEALTARHRVGMYDHTFKHVMDWGLGFIPDSKQYGEGVPYPYGRLCSPRTFGHSGYRSSTGFVDPRHGLAVALAFNGLPSDADHEARMRAVLEGLYEDLGLAGS